MACFFLAVPRGINRIIRCSIARFSAWWFGHFSSSKKKHIFRASTDSITQEQRKKFSLAPPSPTRFPTVETQNNEAVLRAGWRVLNI